MNPSIDQNLSTRTTAGLTVLAANSAANDDHVSTTDQGAAGANSLIRSGIESTGGWNAYDVWRRLIKDARDRRETRGTSTF